MAPANDGRYLAIIATQTVAGPRLSTEKAMASAIRIIKASTAPAIILTISGLRPACLINAGKSLLITLATITAIA